MKKLIEIKISKATLFLTVDEYERALMRGKVLLRSRKLKDRLDKKKH